ncbi:MAG: ABC transporter permease [Pseudomonadales bacterium]|nr:ABC transporter permease [Pseudomonadales bacterium]
MLTMPTVSYEMMLFAFIPSVAVFIFMRSWSLNVGQAMWANARMFIQLIAVGYVLTFVFETNNPILVCVIVVLMIVIATAIAIRPLKEKSSRRYLIALAALAIPGMIILAIVTQLVVDLPRWFEPRFVVPIAGMIFANAMNTVSLAAERYEAELGRAQPYEHARNIAMDAAMIPQINALLAVGLVSLPGMMTGQILSGVEPLVAVKYQIVVMCMIFSSAGLGAIVYLIGMASQAKRPSPAST